MPDELKDLSFAESMMIARVRHNRCLVRVSSGRAKMIANAIAWESPTVLVYHTLPPTREEMDDVLAVIFTGSAPPTNEDFQRTPMLARRDKVSKALEWLKLNHRDYADLNISRDIGPRAATARITKQQSAANKRAMTQSRSAWTEALKRFLCLRLAGVTAILRSLTGDGAERCSLSMASSLCTTIQLFTMEPG